MMNKNITHLLLSAVIFMSAACNVRAVETRDSSNYFSVVLQRLKTLFAGSKGTPVIECTQELESLRQKENTAYFTYQPVVERLTEASDFLNKQSDDMTEDARSLYEHSLSMKIEATCTKIRSANYLLFKTD